MQLEKATSRSHDAALAGWISSNDATLFTTVLVLAIAIFLFAQLSQGAREKLQISREAGALAKQLESTASELDASKNKLGETLEALQHTQLERKRLQQQVDERLDDISRLSLKLDALLREKTELESHQRELSQAKESLVQAKATLLAERSSIVEERETLRTVNISLHEQVAALSRQLSQKIEAAKEAEQQRGRLKQQADELEAVVRGLKQRVIELKDDLSESQNRAAADRAELDARVEGLQNRLAQADTEAKDYLARLKRATAHFEGLRAEKEQLQQALTEAERQHQAKLLEEARNNQQLLGLSGSLDRVAILFDVSGSMRQAGSGGADRWAEAQEIATRWLQHLNVQQCVLIVFASDVRIFPADGALANLQGEAGKANREALLQRLKSISPGGWTNTHAALQKAYEYDIDSILLFSDGVPTPPDSGQFDASVVQRIYELCRQHPGIPVHTIGLGNYFEPNASNFLRSIAKISGGTFRGK